MDFSKLLKTAKQNDSSSSQVNYYKSKFEPPKKYSQTTTQLGDNVKKFLAKRSEEEKMKRENEEKKRAELLSLRAQDTKSKKRISLMLKSTKSASKAAIADARDDNDTAITMLGPSQPDEDDYGYTSKEASAFYEQIMNKYNSTPAEPDKFSKKHKASIKSAAQISDTKKRVLEAMEKQRMEELMPHRRKRRSKERPKDDGDEDTVYHEHDDEQEEETEHIAPPKPKRPAPPPMDFRELLKIAAEKKNEPIIFEPKLSVKDPEEERPMTKKERIEYERQKQWKERREARQKEDLVRARDPTKIEFSSRKSETVGTTPTMSRILKKSSASSESCPASFTGQKAAVHKPIRDDYSRASQYSPGSSQVSSKFNDVGSLHSSKLSSSRPSDRIGTPRSDERSNSNSYPPKSKLRDEISKLGDSPVENRSNESGMSKKAMIEKKPYSQERSHNQLSKPSSGDRKMQEQVRKPVQDQGKRPERAFSENKSVESSTVDRRKEELNKKSAPVSKINIQQRKIQNSSTKSGERRPVSTSSSAIRSVSPDDRSNDKRPTILPKSVNKNISSKTMDDKRSLGDKRPIPYGTDKKPSTTERRSIASNAEKKPIPFSTDRRRVVHDVNKSPMPPDASRKPVPAGADRRPMPSSAEKMPLSPSGNKRPMPSSVERRPLPSGSEKKPMPPCAIRGPIPPSADRRPIPPGADRRPIPPGADRRPIPPGADRRPIPPGADRRPIPPGADRRPIPPGADRRPIPPGADRRPMPPGSDRRPILPGADRRPIPPGADRRPIPPDANRRPIPLGADRRPMAGQHRPQLNNGQTSRPGQSRPPLKRKRPPDTGYRKQRIESDSEYDSEMDDFIDDGPEEDMVANVSDIIADIFKYDKRKYRNVDDDDECMESNFAQQQKEEFVSAKLGLLEDLEDIKQEQMQKKRKAISKNSKRGRK